MPQETTQPEKEELYGSCCKDKPSGEDKAQRRAAVGTEQGGQPREGRRRGPQLAC